MRLDTVNNQAWLIANSKESEFEAWCAKNEISASNPWSLHFFKKELERVEAKRKMASPFLSRSGFFICWTDGSGLCWIFNQSRHDADVLFSTLRSKDSTVEKYQLKDGELKRLA